jgi:hypothetical protein
MLIVSNKIKTELIYYKYRESHYLKSSKKFAKVLSQIIELSEITVI